MLQLAYNNNMICPDSLEKRYFVLSPSECFNNFYLDILNVSIYKIIM